MRKSQGAPPAELVQGQAEQVFAMYAGAVKQVLPLVQVPCGGTFFLMAGQGSNRQLRLGGEKSAGQVAPAERRV